jgi:hypothetical protein
MSNSNGDVNVVSENGPIRIELFDHQFNRQAIGFGKLKTHVPSGLYLLRSTAGIEQRENYLRVDADKTLDTIYIKLPFSSTAPFIGNSSSHEFHSNSAATLSRQPNKLLGNGGRLMIFARTIDGNGRASVSFDGLSLLDANMHPILDMSVEPKQNTEEGWAGQCLELNPGGYALRWKIHKAEGDFSIINQSLFVTQGWLTIVFLAYRSETKQLERQSASIHMVRIAKGFDGNEVNSNQAIELTLIGLRTGHLVVPDELLKDELENPMLGILGAHALLQRSQKNWNAFDRVLEQLEKLIPSHPDVIGLRLIEKFNKPDAKETNFVPMSWPPMLYIGYRALISSDWTPELLNENLIVEDSIAEKAVISILSESPWTSWIENKKNTNINLLIDQVILKNPILGRTLNKLYQDTFLDDKNHITLYTILHEVAKRDHPIISYAMGNRLKTISENIIASDSFAFLALYTPVIKRVMRYIYDLKEICDNEEFDRLSLDDFRGLGLPVTTVKKVLKYLPEVTEFSIEWINNILNTTDVNDKEEVVAEQNSETLEFGA